MLTVRRRICIQDTHFEYPGFMAIYLLSRHLWLAMLESSISVFNSDDTSFLAMSILQTIFENQLFCRRWPFGRSTVGQGQIAWFTCNWS
jgi:hypothetical protein